MELLQFQQAASYRFLSLDQRTASKIDFESKPE
jgi:hypothetical protein